MKRFVSFQRSSVSLVFALAVFAAPVAAQERREAELLRAMTGPGSTAEYRTYRGGLPGAEEQDGIQLRFEPAYSWDLGGGDFVLGRVSLPIFLDQPYWAVRDGDPVWRRAREYPDWLLRQSPQIAAGTGEFRSGHGHMWDIRVDLGLGRRPEPGRFGVFGVTWVLPTNEDVSNARDQYLFGPDVTLGVAGERGELGVRFTHLVDVTGDRSIGTNETTLQLLASWRLADSLRLVSSPVVLYDWEGDSGNRLLLPVGGGAAVRLAVGGFAFDLVAEAYRHVRTAERFGVDRLYRLSFRPVLGAD